MNAADQWQRQMADPATPYWVKAVLDLVVQRDPVDAANGLEVIAEVAARRADEALAAGLAAGEEQPKERRPEPLRRFLGEIEGMVGSKVRFLDQSHGVSRACFLFGKVLNAIMHPMLRAVVSAVPRKLACRLARSPRCRQSGTPPSAGLAGGSHPSSPGQ